ncbi:MAG: protein translocase subunit SecD [Lachnospiraceae bacterium]|nr:protein translocase subunit SecD [Lachnospiraceae bacterium]MDD3615748.1 protein translocase subunit SecD [Lachnospiraceae bacterium]
MKKSRGIIVLVLTAVILGLLAFTSAVGFGPTGTGAARNIKTGLDLSGGVSITYQTTDENPSSEDMSDTIYKLQQRVQQYSEEAQVYQEGDNRINIEIPGVSDANTILEDLGKPGSLYFIAQTDADGNQNYSQIASTGDAAQDYQLNYTIEELEASDSIVLTGTDVASARAGQIENSMQNKENAVSLTLTSEGTTKFADATTKAFGANESIGIYYDGAFVSVPGVNSAITDGNAQITGMADYAEAENLAATIRIGGLKLELEELRSNVVGAQLGEDAIRTSLIAGAIGLVLVILFMIWVYLVPGVVAGLSLLIYVGLELLMLNAFDLTLTLPGIAGIVLSIGMAVDANVIIYARIREEITAGRNTKVAIKAGYEKALSAILDGNITTLIAAAVLGWLGSGSVRGFAMTLALGIVLSMFTALVVSRMIIRALYAVGIRKESLYARQKKEKVRDFLGKRKIFFIISLVLVIAAPVSMIAFHATSGKALNYSLEFQGGTSTTVTFNEDMSIADIDAKVKPVVQEVTGDANIQTQKVVGSNDVVIKTRGLELDEREELNQKLMENFDVEEDKIAAESISSTISGEMRRDAVVAIIVATVCMLLYIWLRFKDLRFASSAVLALLHDVFVVLAFYALARVSVGNTFIACMLTIVGYSINATIVIFDRIRENMAGANRKTDIAEVVNRSISQTLTRSIYTSLTTFIMVAVLFIMGVASIREFALPIMVGIVCGAYSSVCITGALWYVMKTKIKAKK